MQNRSSTRRCWANYKFIPYVVMLELILILLSIHGFNGLRVILLELKQGRAVRKGSLVWVFGGHDCADSVRI